MSLFQGSLTHKRKADLYEITQAIGVPNVDGETIKTDLVKAIQTHLQANEAELAQKPEFKALYNRRSRHSSDPETPDLKQGAEGVARAIEGSVKKSRKSINKVVDRVANTIDPATIALPESPLNLQRIQRVAENVQEVAQEQIVAAQEQLSVALAPAQEIIQRGDYAVQLREAQAQLTTFGNKSKLRVERYTRLLQHHLSQPEQLVGTALGIELLFLVAHVSQFYDHTVFFPPPGGENGTFASLLHSLFFWLPTFSSTFRVPDWYGFRPKADLWPSLAWWTATTVLPPFALSTLISFVPQKGVARKDHTTRYSGKSTSHPPSPTADPLTFALIRLAILLYPLTDAAPSSFVNSLELTGNLQARALGAGLLAALLLVNRLT